MQKPTQKPAKKKSSDLVEHEFARRGDWSVHYYTDDNDAFASASMSRYYVGNQMLRITMDATHMHVDTAADWKKFEGAATNKKTGKISFTIATDQSSRDNNLKYEGAVIDQGGDKWLRMSQSYDEPGGLADIYE